MGYMEIGDYYEILFSLRYDHNFTMMEIYDLLPFERDVFLIMIQKRIREKEENASR